MNMKRKNYYLLCFLLTVMFLPAIVEAKHIIGGDMTYECLGVVTPGIKRWRFTLHIYRDCLGGGPDFDQPIPVAVYRGKEDNNWLYKSFDVYYDQSATLIPDTPQCVSNLPWVCVEEAVYEFTQDLPVLTDSSYFIVHQRCCRNETITNILGPGDVGATYSIELTAEAMAVSNNSPIFTNFPPIIICNNLPFHFNHQATDPEGDILVYSFCEAVAGGGNPATSSDPFGCGSVIPTPPCPPPFTIVPYALPDYNYNNPMGGNPPLTINPVTGEITGTPTKLGQFVVAVCVQEYRNGKLLSTIKREFQFNVADCSPDIDAKLSSDSLTVLMEDYTIKSCGNRTIFFQNKTTVASNVKDVEWRFDVNGTTVSDKVNKWFTAFTFPDTGIYNGMLLINQSNGGCSDTAYIHVHIFPEIKASFASDYDTCDAGPVLFLDQSYGQGILERWKWSFGIPGAGSSKPNPSFQFPEPGNHPVTLRVIDRNQCTDDTTVVVRWFPVPPVIILQPSSYEGCAPASIYFNNLSAIIDETYHIHWDFGDGDTLENVISPTHLYDKPGVYDVRVEVTSPIGCFTSADFPKLISVEAPPEADFACDPDSGLTNFNHTVHFLDKSQGAAHWNWKIGPDFTTLEQSPTYTFPDTGHVFVRLLVTHRLGCRDSIVKELDIRPVTSWFMPNAFTPNGDGTNDEFGGKGFLYGATNFKMSIWNRWGELVFETTDPNERWNGRKRNTEGLSPEGVYIYTVSFTGPRGESNEFKGFATIVR